ncbi:MAG: UvrD-helicase domain-containing protein [Verrucomicrobia bacterium]|nr:UvrD-helicase domain-containing protein [Verrucomicrobiota bacterium]
MLDYVRPRLDQWLHGQRWITFDGIISRVHDALHDKGSGPALAAALRKRHKIGLIDESQDTDPRQFAIFKKIFLEPADDPCRMVLIGDPKQAIYAFRGADLNTYLNARAQAGAKVFSLNQTYRAPPKLVAAVNAFFQGKQAFLNPGLQFMPAQSGMSAERWLAGDPDGNNEHRVEVWICPSDTSLPGNKQQLTQLLAESIAARIAAILVSQSRLESGTDNANPLASRLVHPGDFAVLVGDHFEAEAMLMPCIYAVYQP